MSNQQLKIIFAGTPEFAAVALKALLKQGHDVCAVYCQPDRPSGRGKKLIAGPVKKLALEHQIPVEQPINFKDPKAVERLASYQADLMIVVAYGLLLPLPVLETPKYGCVNIHGSILPRWRGAAPIHRAIEAGDKQTGITIMQMDQGLDTGNMLLKLNCEITENETGSSLHDKLADLGGKAINQFLAEFDPDNSGEKQDDSLANYAHKLSKQEACIDWSLSSAQILNKIRAFNAWPVSYTFVNGNRIRVWKADVSNLESPDIPGTVVEFNKQGISVVCGDRKVIDLTILQPDGGKAMDASALLNSKSSWFENHPVLGENQ
ncbi:MAG: methionyl-tRNA formyltransferase [Kangiellaceae bacterium]|nr:methionyl-tRNA formyltransferase [Kangiellaceae bacterium]